MDPDLNLGTRKRFTALDAAAMDDIGWDVIPPPKNYGDYNNNGVVDGADYVVWRNNRNLSVTIPNDQTPGMVTAADYTVWRTNFGDVLGSGSGNGSSLLESAVPEPAAGILVLLAASAVCFARRR
jgi:hypothetical protein